MTGDKRNIRQTVRAARDAINPTQRAAWSERICAAACARPEYAAARVVHLFLSFGSEIDTTVLIAHALGVGKQVCVPVFVKGSDETPAAALTSLDEGAFELGVWGTRTPRPIQPVALAEIDLVFVPMAAFAQVDGRLHRVGYGAGFYDRLLTRLRPGVPKLGLAFEIQRVTTLPVATHDMPLDAVITERPTP
jgi:5-formyltetrahydrofolate cyclo-ligase